MEGWFWIAAPQSGNQNLAFAGLPGGGGGVSRITLLKMLFKKENSK